MNEYFLLPKNKIVSILIKILSNLYALPILIERENASHRDGTRWELESVGNHTLLRIHKPDLSDIRINISLLWNATSSQSVLNSAKKMLLFLLVEYMINTTVQRSGYRGNFSLGIALGMILLVLSLIVNVVLSLLQRRLSR